MILYHPATDFYHCWMRCAYLLCHCREKGIEFDRLRIIDFLLCFPHELETCRLPAARSAELRKMIRRVPCTYEDSSSIRQGFRQISKVQGQVAMDMVSKGVLQGTAYREGLLIPSVDISTSGLIDEVVELWENRKAEWRHLAVDALLSIPLNGHNGLKARSGLLEYRYDG
jgi:hypothetical protein